MTLFVYYCFLYARNKPTLHYYYTSPLADHHNKQARNTSYA